MTTVRGQNPPTWRGLIVLLLAALGVTAGLCTVFALVVTTAQAWQEHSHTEWPEARASVQTCGVSVYTYKPKA